MWFWRALFGRTDALPVPTGAPWESCGKPDEIELDLPRGNGSKRASKNTNQFFFPRWVPELSRRANGARAKKLPTDNSNAGNLANEI